MLLIKCHEKSFAIVDQAQKTLSKQKIPDCFVHTSISRVREFKTHLTVISFEEH